MGVKSYTKILISSAVALISLIIMLFNFADDLIFRGQLFVVELLILGSIFVVFSVFWKRKFASMITYCFFAIVLIDGVYVFLNSSPNFWFLLVVLATLIGMTEALAIYKPFPKLNIKTIMRKKVKKKYEQIADELKDVSVGKPQIIVEEKGKQRQISPEELFKKIKKRADEIKKVTGEVAKKKEKKKSAKKKIIRKKIKPKKKAAKKPAKKRKSRRKTSSRRKK